MFFGIDIFFSFGVISSINESLDNHAKISPEGKELLYFAHTIKYHQPPYPIKITIDFTS